VAVDLSFKIISHALFDRWMESFAIDYFCCIGYSLASIFSQFSVIAWQNELQELVVAETATAIDIIELHHQLAVLDPELQSVVLLQEVIKIDGKEFLIAIRIEAAKSRVGLEIIERSHFLPLLFNLEFQIS